jgi:(2R)-3-sulfolactate dehydrogenase (NADP+)
MPVISIADAERYASTALRMVGFAQKAADSTARALVLAESQGISSHGLTRISQYISHLKNDRINPQAEPLVIKRNHA